jgi:integrase/recombinase XerD
MSSTVPTNKKVFRSLKLDAWPETDRRLLQEALKPKAFLKPGGAAAGWRDKTLEGVVYRYGVFLWWLHETGRLAPTSTPIARITPDNIEAFVNQYGACHASTSLAGTVHGVYEATRVMHPEADLAYLREVVAALKTTARPRPKALRIADHRALIELGEALIAHGAARAEQDHLLSAVAMRDGCMILFAVACPLRHSNFEDLRLGASLLREERGYRVRFEASQMKNHQPFDADIPEWLTARLARYCETARRVLQRRSNEPDGGWLWLGAEGEHMTGKAISRRVRQLTARHLGREMSLHLFRDGATTTVAVEAGEYIGIAGDLLGHTDHRTSEKYYNQARGSRRLGAIMSC